MNRLLASLDSILTGRFDTSGAIGKARLLVVLAVLSFLFNGSELIRTPYSMFISAKRVDPTSSLLREKIKHPFSQLDTTADKHGHFEKLAFRFIPFVIAHILNLDLRGLYFVQVVLGIVFPLLIWRLLFNVTKSAELSNTVAILITTLYCGFSFFYDAQFFDGFAYFFLTASMLSRDRRLILLLLLCAGFTDERAVVASSLVVAWHAYNSEELTFKVLYKWVLFFVGFLTLYILARLLVGYVTGLRGGDKDVGIDMLGLNLTNIVLLAWSVFEGGWLIVFAAAFALNDERSGPQSVLLWGCVLGFVAIFCAGLMVGDALRSQQYAFPLLLLAIAIIAKSRSIFPTRLRRIAIVLTLATPITIYLSFDRTDKGIVYHMWPLRPGYLRVIDHL